MDGQARVQFYPLLKRKEGDEIMVGRPEISSFIYLPPEGVALIEYLEQGMTIAEAQTAYHVAYGETPDLADLVEGLKEVGFVAKVIAPGEELDATLVAAEPAAAPAGHFSRISPKAAARVFSVPMLVLYGLYTLGALVVMAMRPNLVPRGGDRFFGVSLMISILSLTFYSWFHMFVHEFFHLLAARAVGVPAKLTIGRRLMTPVALTDMSGIYSVAPEQRYLPFLAGMIFDLLAFSTITYLLALSDWGILVMPAVLYVFGKAILVRIGIAVSFQFRLPLRTDLYYVAANWLRTRNLQADTIGFLANLRNRIMRRPATYDLSAVPPRELWMIRAYAPILLICLGLYWVFYVYFTLPYIFKTFPVAFHNVAAGWKANPLLFGDGLVFLVMMGVEWGWLLYVTIRDRRAQRAGRAPAGGETREQATA